MRLGNTTVKRDARAEKGKREKRKGKKDQRKRRCGFEHRNCTELDFFLFVKKETKETMVKPNGRLERIGVIRAMRAAKSGDAVVGALRLGPHGASTATQYDRLLAHVDGISQQVLEDAERQQAEAYVARFPNDGAGQISTSLGLDRFASFMESKKYADSTVRQMKSAISKACSVRVAREPTWDDWTKQPQFDVMMAAWSKYGTFKARQRRGEEPTVRGIVPASRIEELLGVVRRRSGDDIAMAVEVLRVGAIAVEATAGKVEVRVSLWMIFSLVNVIVKLYHLDIVNGERKV